MAQPSLARTDGDSLLHVDEMDNFTRTFLLDHGAFRVLISLKHAFLLRDELPRPIRAQIAMDSQAPTCARRVSSLSLKKRKRSFLTNAADSICREAMNT